MDWINPIGVCCLRITSPEARFWSKRSQLSLYKGSHKWFRHRMLGLHRKYTTYCSRHLYQQEKKAIFKIKSPDQDNKHTKSMQGSKSVQFSLEVLHLQCTTMGRFPDCCCCLCTAAIMSIIPLPSPGIPISGHPWKWMCRTCCDFFSCEKCESFKYFSSYVLK